jgi:hypothetical protein
MSRVLELSRDIAGALDVLDAHGVAHSDAYAFGCVVYRMITGHAPLSAASADLDRTGTEPPALPPETPARLALAVSRCLSIDPAERPDSMREIVREIECAREEYEWAHVRLEAAIDGDGGDEDEGDDGVPEDEAGPRPDAGPRVARVATEPTAITAIDDGWASWFVADDVLPAGLAAELGWVLPRRPWPSRLLSMFATLVLCAVIVVGFAGLAAVAVPSNQLVDWLSRVIP